MAINHPDTLVPSPDAPDRAPTISVSKIEAARRQLGTALDLWFSDGDPVSVHTLAFAAYDIIHAVSKKRNPNRRDLLFDSRRIKDEGRSEWSILLKTPSGFFKHARNDPEGTIDFAPELSELLMIFSIAGLASCQIDPQPIESAFLLYHGFQRPDFFNEEGRKFYIDSISAEDLEDIQRLPKRVFLDNFLKGRSSR